MLAFIVHLRFVSVKMCPSKGAVKNPSTRTMKGRHAERATATPCRRSGCPMASSIICAALLYVNSDMLVFVMEQQFASTCMWMP